MRGKAEGEETFQKKKFKPPIFAPCLQLFQFLKFQVPKTITHQNEY